jgi:hypothetical protein
MYYHVLITTTAAPDKWRVALSDLSEAHLKTRFVAPYGSGRDLVCGNEVVPVLDIHKRCIIATEHPEASERATINARDLAGVAELNSDSNGPVFITVGAGYDPGDLLAAGKNVTDEYLDGPPGSSLGVRSRVSTVLNHPWVVAIATGVIVAGILIWLGWG